jgi:hypothetical protein
VIILVDARAAKIGVWRRAPSGWTFEDYEGMSASIPLPEVGAALSLQELYAGHGFE